MFCELDVAPPPEVAGGAGTVTAGAAGADGTAAGDRTDGIAGTVTDGTTGTGVGRVGTVGAGSCAAAPAGAPSAARVLYDRLALGIAEPEQPEVAVVGPAADPVTPAGRGRAYDLAVRYIAAAALIVSVVFLVAVLLA